MFLGGQDGPPSIGGRFDLRDTAESPPPDHDSDDRTESQAARGFPVA
jgi:hypothetical protein